MTPGERAAALADLPRWRFDQERNGIAATFTFPDFPAAFAFMTRAALYAERVDHHPDWRNVWNRVDILLTTHDAGGVTRKDIDFARTVEALVGNEPGGRLEQSDPLQRSAAPMKLYYSPGACSLAPHITLREAGLAFEPVKTDIRAKKLPDGSDYFAVNPKGAVPALQLDDGDVLTENAAVLQYIADQAPGAGLIPASGAARYHVLEWLSYVGSEVHKSYGMLWNPASSDEAKQVARDLLAKKFDFVAGQLGEKPFLTGETFTPADAYFFVMLSWTRLKNIDLSRWPTLVAFQERVAARPAVQEAMRAEGLIR